MKYEYTSAFAEEMRGYLSMLDQAGRYTAKIQSTLRALDKYLTEHNISEFALSADTTSDWLKTRDVRQNTKASDVSNVRGFAKYLSALGIPADCPEPPKAWDSYTAYLFSDTELERIFVCADNFEASDSRGTSALVFPVLLRILYSCGLRLGEGLSLRWKDVDLDDGVLTIREAKNQKQRFVPMDPSMTGLLTDFREMADRDGICDDYLFESDCQADDHFRNNTFYVWFMDILDVAGIVYAKTDNRERGPCPHCLRNVFTMKSLLKSEQEGRRFEDTAPFLAAYLGHDSPKDTEAYLSKNHTLYKQSHKRVDAAIGGVFPEVDFDGD